MGETLSQIRTGNSPHAMASLRNLAIEPCSWQGRTPSPRADAGPAWIRFAPSTRARRERDGPARF